MRRVLITGATGGLGKQLSRSARAMGYKVRATGRSVSEGNALTAIGCEFVAADLCANENLDALVKGMDSVIHAAALSASWGSWETFRKINIEATQHLLMAAEAANCRRFVFVSSPSIFANFEDRLNIGADDQPTPRPLNNYARSKLEAEKIVLAHNGNMACTAIRPRALVGEGDRVILPRLTELAMRSRVPLPDGGRALIELTDLRDAAQAILSAEQFAPDLRRAATNISGGNPQSVRTVAHRLASVLERDPKFIDLPLFVTRAMAGLIERSAQIIGSKNEPSLTRYTLATLAYSQTFDLTPARERLGYVPKFNAFETLLSEATKQTIGATG